MITCLEDGGNKCKNKLIMFNKKMNRFEIKKWLYYLLLNLILLNKTIYLLWDKRKNKNINKKN